MAAFVINGVGRICLFIFGFVFAINSSLHSYIILAINEFERITMNIGFYYLSNAASRLAGKFLFGASYQFGGLPACLSWATILFLLCWLFTFSLEILEEER